jgi:hypothetical protein
MNVVISSTVTSSSLLAPKPRVRRQNWSVAVVITMGAASWCITAHQYCTATSFPHQSCSDTATLRCYGISVLVLRGTTRLWLRRQLESRGTQSQPHDSEHTETRHDSHYLGPYLSPSCICWRQHVFVCFFFLSFIRQLLTTSIPTYILAVMYLSILPAFTLLSLVTAQSTSVVGTVSVCAAQPVLEACLASTEAVSFPMYFLLISMSCSSWNIRRST